MTQTVIKRIGLPYQCDFCRNVSNTLHIVRERIEPGKEWSGRMYHLCPSCYGEGQDYGEDE